MNDREYSYQALLFTLLLLGGMLLGGALPLAVASGQDNPSRFETSDSRANYVHRIQLFDKMNTRILPGENANPYSPKRTCGRCHEYAHIAKGFHFNPDADSQDHGRPGETWIWSDETTGTQLPLSFRDWVNSYSPSEIGITDWEFVQQFGGRTPGGYPGMVKEGRVALDEEDDQPVTESNRFKLSGELDLDCMICHSKGSVFNLEAWSKQIEDQNFAWASTAAIGLAKVDGQVRRLKDDFDIEASKAEGYSGATLPTTDYDESRFDAEGNVFFDIVRVPPNNSCYRCHSRIDVGPSAMPRWNHDKDVHLRAGFQCVDCHRNDLGHNIVRGFEGEVHPQSQYATSLSCEGCHIGSDSEGFSYQNSGGRMGAPLPQHKGLPPIHLERISCTACHSGPIINDEAGQVQTSLSHLLGHKAHREAHQLPRILQPVLMPNDDDVLYPHRVMWPSFWGTNADGVITPLNPIVTKDLLKSSLRVRSDFLEEITKVRLSRAQKTEALGEERGVLKEDQLTDEEKQTLADLLKEEGLKQFNERMEKALVKLKEEGHANPVYVSGEELFQLNETDKLEVVDNPNPQPYSWPIAHDVRPARWALGANGCKDCHSKESPFFYANVITQSPVPDDDPSSAPMHEYANLDAELLGTWNRSFQGRSAFKWTAIVSVASVASIVIVFVLYLFAGNFRGMRRRG